MGPTTDSVPCVRRLLVFDILFLPVILLLLLAMPDLMHSMPASIPSSPSTPRAIRSSPVPIDETGGFLRAQCPRPEDIHPCTCILIPKNVDEEVEDEFEEERRFARSTVLHDSDVPVFRSVTNESPFSSSSSSPSTAKSFHYSDAPSMSLMFTPSLPVSSSLSEAGDEAQDSPTTTVLSPSGDPEVATTVNPGTGEVGDGSSSEDLDATSTPAPRFRVVPFITEEAHVPSLAVTADDEVDLTTTTSPDVSSVRNPDQEESVSSAEYQSAVDTTPPPMPLLSETIASRNTVSPDLDQRDRNSTTDAPAKLGTASMTTTPVPEIVTTTPTPPVPSSSSLSSSSSSPAAPPAPLALIQYKPVITSAQTSPSLSSSSSPPPTTTSSPMPQSSPSSSSSSSSSRGGEPVWLANNRTEDHDVSGPLILHSPTSEKRVMLIASAEVGTPDVKDSIVPENVKRMTSASSGGDRSQDHWSLWESMLVCRNVRSSRVIADTLRSMKGYHFNFVVLDNVKLPQPFPFSLFNRFSFDFLELLNLGSLQFVDNFDDKGREYYYGRSQRGAVDDRVTSSRSPAGVPTVSVSESSPSASWSHPSQQPPSPAQQFSPEKQSHSRRRRRK